jgi:hypothetical protein
MNDWLLSKLRKTKYYLLCLGSTLNVISLSRLAKYCGTDKSDGHNYIPIYRNFLAPLKYHKIKFLEIGIGGYEDVHKGGQSLKMWEMYFPLAQIVGIDYYEKRLSFSRRVRILQGRQEDPLFLKTLIKNVGTFDVIIDDGSHINSHIIKTFEVLFPSLSDNGLYVIEDTQTSYWPDYGDGQNSKGITAMEYFKKLIDGLNYEEFIDPTYSPTYFDKYIVAIHFFHNLIIIQKGRNVDGSNIVQNLRHD